MDSPVDFRRMRVPQVEHAVTELYWRQLSRLQSLVRFTQPWYQRDTCVTRLQHCISRYSPSEGFHTVFFTKFLSRGIGRLMAMEQTLVKGFVWIQNCQKISARIRTLWILKQQPYYLLYKWCLRVWKKFI